MSVQPQRVPGQETSVLPEVRSPRRFSKRVHCDQASKRMLHCNVAVLGTVPLQDPKAWRQNADGAGASSDSQTRWHQQGKRKRKSSNITVLHTL